MECIIYNETNVLWWIFWCSTLKAGKHPSYIFLCFSIWFLGIYNHSACDQCREIMISAIYLYDFSLSVIWTFFLDLIECYCQIMTSQIKIITLALNAYTVILSVSMTLILKIICQCDVEHILMLPIKIVTLVLKVFTYIITSTTVRLIGLATILMILLSLYIYRQIGHFPFDMCRQ